jgi:RNA polymerase sigma-70 factor (ECF subfamily)
VDRGLTPQVADPGPSVARKFELVEVRRKIEAALESIPAAFRELFVLRHINEFSYEEIADIKDLPVGTVKNRVFQAKEMLRKRLEGS